MKGVIYLSLILLGSSCVTKKSSLSTANSVALVARIKNHSDLMISRLVLTNSSGDTVEYQGIKPTKTSTYRTVNALCSCGYNVEIWYSRKDGTPLKATKNCVNIMPCTDYFKGRLLITLNAPKNIPASTKDIDVELEFTPE